MPLRAYASMISFSWRGVLSILKEVLGFVTVTHTKHELDLTAICFRSRLTGESGKHRIVVRHGKFIVRRSLGIEVRSCQDDRDFLTETL